MMRRGTRASRARNRLISFKEAGFVAQLAKAKPMRSGKATEAGVDSLRPVDPKEIAECLKQPAVTAVILPLNPGLFALDINAIDCASARISGLQLPLIQVSAAPAGQGRCRGSRLRRPGDVVRTRGRHRHRQIAIRRRPCIADRLQRSRATRRAATFRNPPTGPTTPRWHGIARRGSGLRARGD